MTQMAATNTIIQTIVDERFRGRVMSFYTMAFFGTTPIGSLLGGVLADRVGAPLTIRLGGLVCLGAAAWFAVMLPTLRPLVRKIYIERGIIAAPDVDAGTSMP
jgi:MFS family permease